MDGALYRPEAGCVASIELAIVELDRAARQKRELSGSFLAGTLTDIAVHHLRAAARQAPRPHRMRLARLAGRMRMHMRYTGRTPAPPSLTVSAIIAREVADAIERRAA